LRKAIALALVSLGCACSGTGEKKPRTSVVRIGVLLDRSGSIATASWSDSIRLAVATVNDALIRSGHPSWRFEIAEADSANAPPVAREAALELVRREGAKALVTDSSPDDVAVNALFYDGVPQHELGVPVVCIACTSPRIDAPAASAAAPAERAALRNVNGWNFRTAVSAESEAQALAPLLLSRVHGVAARIAIYSTDDADGRAFSDAVKKRIIEARPAARVAQIFHDATVDPATYDWAADVARLVERGDVVLAASYPRLLVGFMKAWVDSETRVPIVQDDGFRSARLLQALNVSIEGHEGISQAVLGDGASGRIFARDLEARTAQPPALRDAAAYDAAMTLMLATLHAAHAARIADPADVSGASIRDSMRAINDKAGETVEAGVLGIGKAIRLIDAGKPIDYAGASGPCDYDGNGDVVAQLSRYRVEGGRFVEVAKIGHTCDVRQSVPPRASCTAP
jgi:ABC-type branched-subunit amino acid transport system substrate-binding protein